MSRSDWLRNGAIGALILLVCSGAVWWGLAYKQEQAQQREHTAPRAADPSQKEARETCQGVTGLVDYENCITEKQKAQRDEQRTQYDLQAQQQMALWAFALFISGVLGLGITGAGVYYVAQTLGATREAVGAANRTADEAKRIGEAQVRAYVTVANVQLRFAETSPMVTFELHNSGNSPALELHPAVSLVIRLPSHERQIGSLDGATGVLIGTLRQGGMHKQTLFVGSTVVPSEALAIMETERGFADIRIDAHYKDVFGNHISERFNFTGIMRDPRPSRVFNLSPQFEFILPTGTHNG